MGQGPAPRPYTPEARASTPLWVWLLVGVLLGTGGTLLTSVLWLPDQAQPEIADASPGSDASREDEQSAATVLVEPAADSLETADAEQVDGVGGPIDTIDDDGSTPGESALAAGPPVPVLRAPAGQNTQERRALPPDGGDQTAADTTHLRNADAEAALRALISKNKKPAPREALVGSTFADDLDQSVEVADLSEQILPLPEPAAARADEEGRRATTSTLEEPTGPQDESSVELPRRIRQALQRETPDLPSASATVAAGGPLYRVQLAAVNDEAAAQVYWREVNERLPGVFTDVQPIFDERLVDERLFLRIWVGAFDNRVDALGYCGWLKQQGQDCFVTRVDKL